tara:strand:+ start:259 stop:732 length:474 start_codon:yes stop_codon:yes gene_type:complete
MQQVLALLDPVLAQLENPYVATFLSLFLAMYGGLAAPQLPSNIAAVFNSDVGRLVVLFLIVFMSVKNPTLAILTAVGFTLSLQVLNQHKLFGNIVDEAVEVAEEETSAEPSPAEEAVAPAPLEVANQRDEIVVNEARPAVESVVVGFGDESSGAPLE